ncbi:MAG: family 16 glycosylhydrolase [Actinomycetota bacterium]|nr:family 16 glycosylhydrolase [Actinomycetota bacterium]
MAALVAGAMLALAGKELARADPSSSPFPPAVVAAAPAPAPPREPAEPVVPAGDPGPVDDPGPPGSDAAASQPAASQPAAPEPVASEPAASEPAGPEPAGAEPAASYPAPRDANEPDPNEPDPSEPGPKAADPKQPGPRADPNEPDRNAADPNGRSPGTAGPNETDRKAADPNEPGPGAAAPNEPDPNEPDPNEPDPKAADPKAADPKAAAPTAAERYGWGTPLPGSDEFDYTGRPDPAKWNVAGECWAGHAGNGGRCAGRSTVDGSKLVQTGLANGNSAWLASKVDQRYGRWEARVRSKATGPDNGRQYHPLLIVWPTSNRWPQDGEYDFLENGAPGQDCAEAFIHYPHDAGVAVQQEFVKEKDCGAPLSEWHTVAFEWTPDHVRGYIDGAKWFDLFGGATGIRKKIQGMPSGHLTIQLDNFFGGNMQPATYEVDWVRIYALR